ncbi:MAG: SDR family NAD(P)-dependent oxidoreductase [Chloroflexota bacterium]|nr:MAG: SDR family NAD(P)-dependent oxidoreductase [Chloroflexota bacterium]
MTNQTLPAARPLEPRPCALVLGASSGIGAALTRLLAQNGYFVAAVARREALLVELCAEINEESESGPRALYYSHNVTDYGAVPALFQKIAADLGGLDLVIYSAAVQPTMTPDEYSFDKDEAMAKINLLGAMAWMGQAAIRFQRAGSGHIVGISSLAAVRGRRMNPGYNATKAGLDTYLEALRNRLTQNGATVTTIRPGFVETRLLENASSAMWVISPDEAARQILKAIRRRKQTVYVPGRWRYVSLIITHTPSFIFRRLNI